jgi:dinuclear metal center YbgI/SA1388 family protein
MRLNDLIDWLEKTAPTAAAEAWDNVGLLVGDPASAVERVLLTIDYTRAVAAEAAEKGCQLVIAYHPPIFSPLKRLRAGEVVFDSIQRGIAIYSPHTALDVADGGTNDVLADILGLVDRGPLKRNATTAKQYKLVTFVPKDALEKVSSALFAAGAGRIGNYTSCSFQSNGTGTFVGGEGTNPAVGKAGQMERADEIRIETIVPISSIDEIVRALRNAHPYEEPAFDLIALAAPPTTQGIGRVGNLKPRPRQELFETIKREIGVGQLLIAGPTDGDVSRAAVCAGSGGDFVDDAIDAGAGLYLTGEIKHHHALKAAAAGMTVVCTLHSNSERVTLKHLQARLEAAFPQLTVQLAAADRDPFSIR